MNLIADDPIVAGIERTGYPPWIDADFAEIEEGENDDER